ncbi:MAG: AhpC/TSA family protein [Mediterranea sp.]|jgi:thiol-disulfide isomerase/thioredoxin|nr:AhpC/TSA family protein [Mediterranea sp.]
MRNLLVWAIVVFTAFFCGKKKDELFIRGTVGEIASGKVYLQKFENKMFQLIDSAEIKDGKFSISKTDVQLPEIYGLSLSSNPLDGQLFVFLDKKPVTIRLDSSSYYSNSVVTGSELQDLFSEYRKQKPVHVDEFIKAHPKSLVSAYVLYRDFSYQLSREEILSNIQLLDPALWDTQYVKVLKDLTATLEIVGIGKPAPDFTENDTEGNPVKFSEYLGKGYVLIDFWASWCGPCRMENPYVVQAYNKYKNKGFTIFSVSLDKNKEAWLKGIEEDGLTWTHVSDLLFWNSKPAKLYGIRAIPANYLIDKNGIIVAKNLRGKELDRLLGELLKK